MKFFIKETSTIETLSIIDPKSGVDYISDFIGNAGALSDGQFEYDEDRDAYVCSQANFDWWETVVSENQSLDNRIHELSQEHGLDAVYEIIHAAGSTDLEDHAANVNQALDEAFGSAEQGPKSPSNSSGPEGHRNQHKNLLIIEVPHQRPAEVYETTEDGFINLAFEAASRTEATYESYTRESALDTYGDWEDVDDEMRDLFDRGEHTVYLICDSSGESTCYGESEQGRPTMFEWAWEVMTHDLHGAQHYELPAEASPDRLAVLDEAIGRTGGHQGAKVIAKLRELRNETFEELPPTTDEGEGPSPR